MDWKGDTPKTDMTTRAPAVLTNFIFSHGLGPVRNLKPQDNADSRQMKLLQLVAFVQLIPVSFSRVTLPKDYDKYVGSEIGKNTKQPFY